MFSISHSGNARRGVSPLNTQCLHSSVGTEERKVPPVYSAMCGLQREAKKLYAERNLDPQQLYIKGKKIPLTFSQRINNSPRLECKYLVYRLVREFKGVLRAIFPKFLERAKLYFALYILKYTQTSSAYNKNYIYN